MQNNLHFFRLQRRRPRAWVSWCSSGCLYDAPVVVVHRCPVVGGMPLVQLAWQHKIISA